MGLGFEFQQAQDRNETGSPTWVKKVFIECIGQNKSTSFQTYVEPVSHGCSANLSALSLSADLGRKNTDLCNFEEVGMKLLYSMKSKMFTWLPSNVWKLETFRCFYNGMVAEKDFVSLRYRHRSLKWQLKNTR